MKKETILSFVRFCIVGASNTAISLIIYYILIALNINYLIAISAGYILSSITGYFLSKIWVFKKGQSRIANSIFKYYILYGSALFLNLICMHLFVQGLNIPNTVAPIITIVITTIYNFFLSKYWVFKKSNTPAYLNLKAIKNDKALVAMMVVFFTLVIAVLLNNIFNHPVADDYVNYNDTIAEIGSDQYTPPEAISAIVKLSIKTYQTWQGTHFANILFFINPLLISKNAYKITMLLIQLFWLVGCWFFFKSIPANNQKAKLNNLKLYLLFIIFSILSMYSLGEGLFWFTGSILYIIPFTISLIFFGLIMRFFITPKKQYYYILAILAIILGGTSYVTGIIIGFVLLMIVIISFIKKTKNRLFLSILFILFCISFAFNVFCPGNFTRIDSYEKVSLIKVFYFATTNALEMIKHLLFQTLFIPILLIATPALVCIAQKTNTTFQKNTILIPLCLLCFVATFVPMAYSYGSAFQETRVKNIQLFYLVIMISICYINFIGTKLKGKTFIQNPAIPWLGLLSCLLATMAIGFDNIPGFNLINDYIYMKNVNYNSCMNALENKLQNSEEKTVEITNCEVFPSSLHHYYIQKDNWQTKALELYYDKTIKIKE